MVLWRYSLWRSKHFQPSHVRVLAVQVVGDNHNTQVVGGDGWAGDFGRVAVDGTEGDDHPPIWLFELFKPDLRECQLKGKGEMSPQLSGWGGGSG